MKASALFGAGWEGDCVDVLWEDADRAFCRLRCDDAEGNRHAFVPTLPDSEHPTLESIKRLTHEYELRDYLDSAWALKPVELVRERGRIMLVVQYVGGEPLDRLIGRPMEIGKFLRLAIALSAGLSRLHERRLIHKDIKPANVLVHSATGQVWLTGFCIASRLPRERQSPEPPEFIAGTLAYMAPEQTGRVNRSLDSQSDLYSLGVTIYEILTGGLPFTAADPMEWVHCHIARQPAPPSSLRRDVPTSVSAITMKLLSKTPEERYQTAAGVESDLRRCLAEWEAHGSITNFSPGQHDAPDRLLIPEKLYGRAREIETLLTAFDRVVAGGRPELVLVSGYSGIGKSAVVNELHKPLVPPRGLFASGKFDQYKRDIPYATLAQAFQSLIRPLLSKSEDELNRWRNALHEALDPNGQLMVGLVPELKAVIGEQPPVPDLPQQDAQRRFHLVFRRFINVFARPEHPLALFLDDLQWLDAATLDLMEDLLTQADVKHLMLIGAYRDNEVEPTHPLVRKLEAMRQAGALLQDIVLAPLTREDLEQLMAESLHCEPGHAGPLAALVHDKTSGNPFFAIQFLSALFEEGLLTFDHVEGRWSWDLNRIHGKGYTDNVVDLMVRKLTRLVPVTQNALKQLACLGNSAEFTMLRLVHQDSLEQLHAQLAEAVRAGFILCSKHAYCFLHDRVQEAAYSLIPQELRAEGHLRIGRLLAAHTSPKEREERIFEIVNQLNRGAALISARDEKEQLAEFNLIAGKRAKVSTAYVSALHYLVVGTALLSDDGWDRPDLMFALEFHRAECEFLTGELAAAEPRLAMLVSRAAGPVDQAAVACLRIDLYTTLNRSDLAIDVALSYLGHLGGEWPPHPTEEAVRREYDRTWSLLGGREIEELIDLPLMSKPESAAAVEVMDKALPPALFTDMNLFPLLLWRIVNFSLEHGNTDASCYAYVHGGILAGARFGNYKAGFRFGRLGYDLVERRGLKRFKARTHIGFGVYTVSWTRHWRMVRELIRQGFDAANTIGDVTWAAYSWHNLIGNLLAAGDSLAEAQREAERGLAFARKISFGIVIDNIATQLALIHTLRGLTATFGCFNGPEFDEAQIERRLSSDPGLAFAACWYWTRKLQARFFAGDYSAAVGASLNAQRLLWTSEGFLESAEACFYGALSHAASCDSAPPVQYRQAVEALTGYHKQLSEWAENCPENFENRAALIGAEMARIEGRVLEAEHLYEQAIRSAHKYGFVHNEAIANELAGRFYAARGFEKIATTYLRDARYCYLRWGADGKVRQLEQLYPHLRADKPLSDSMTTILAPVEHLDLATVIKVSEAVSGEIVLEKLIDTLMRTAIEHAGAERGLLILQRGEEYRIEAEVTTSSSEVKVELRQTSVTAADLPESVFRYALRTKECVLMHDASGQSSFSADDYVREHHARSVLCLPLLKQNGLVGVLYLENNLASHVFTPARIVVLKLLASQAAISLENACLYRDAQQTEAYLKEAQTLSHTGSFGWRPAAGEIMWSEETCQITGYDRDTKPTLELMFQRIHPEDRAFVQEVLDRATSDGTDLDVEHRLLLPDGSVKSVHIVAHVVRDESRNIEYIGAIMDITERKLAAEDALRKSEERWRAVFDNSAIGVALTDLSGRLLATNFAYQKMLGYTEEEIGKLTFLELTHEDYREANRQLITELLEGKRNQFQIEKQYWRKDGSLIWVSNNVSLVPGTKTMPRFIMALSEDITARKQAEEAARASERRYHEMEMAHANRIATLGQLSGSIAHELNQPLTGILTNSSTCLRMLTGDPQNLDGVREAVRRTVRDGNRASEVIRRLRALFSKREAIAESVDLNESTREVIALSLGELQKSQVIVRTELADDLPLVTGDRVQLQQVILNLLLNALDAMNGTKDRPRELVIRTEGRKGDWVCVSLRDSGVGFEPHAVDKIFEAFYTTKHDGMGMGLSVSRSIIERHQGRLWAAPNDGPGATFSFSIPCDPGTKGL